MILLARGRRFAGLCLAAASVVMSCLLGCQRDSLLDRRERMSHMHRQRIADNWERRRDRRPQWPPFTQGEVLAVVEERPDVDMTVAEFMEMAVAAGEIDSIVYACEHRATERLPSDQDIADHLGEFRIWVYHWQTPRDLYLTVHGWFLGIGSHTTGPYKVSDYYLFDTEGFLLQPQPAFFRRGVPEIVPPGKQGTRK